VIPDLAGDTALNTFECQNNQLTGSVPVINGLDMAVFNVSHNRLTGSIPVFSSQFANLYQYDVSFNDLTGSIPTLTHASGLILFRANNNRLTGPVPTAPASLNSGPLAGLLGPSSLCPNLLSTNPSGNDAGWNTATGYTPWYASPYANNLCDDIFTAVFEN